MADELSNQAGPADQMPRDMALLQLQQLSFAFASIIQLIPVGSYERENANNAYNGIRERLKNLHSSFIRLTEEKVAMDVARALEPQRVRTAGAQASGLSGAVSGSGIGGAGGFGQIIGGLKPDPLVLIKMKQDAINKIEADAADRTRKKLFGLDVKTSSP